jgi:hypothetical protein
MFKEQLGTPAFSVMTGITGLTHLTLVGINLFVAAVTVGLQFLFNGDTVAGFTGQHLVLSGKSKIRVIGMIEL